MPSPSSLAFAAPAPCRVLIVDDSAVARAVLGRVVDSSDRFVVAGGVTTVAAALDFLAETTVDVILLDIQMPGTDGVTALPSLIAAARGAKVLVVSSAAVDGGAVTLQALAHGAVGTLEKPGAGASTGRFATTLLDRLVTLVDGETAPPPPVSGPTALPRPPAPLPAKTPIVADGYDIVAIGASTGGIHALSALLREIPSNYRLPIIVTQHLPTSFMPYFAAQLALLANRPCEVATDRLRIRPGRVIVAPGDAHLRCVALSDGGAALRLSREPSISGCTPSVDPMLSSMAGVFGPRLLAIMLSGMGRDGAEGARDVREAGGCVIVQDQASSVIWGMPGAVADLADAILPPDAIGRLVAERRRP